MKSLKLFALLLLILTKNSYGQPSTNPNDTICIPVSQAKELLIAKKEYAIQKQTVVLLNQRIDNLQSVIAAMEKSDSLTVAFHSSQLQNLKDQRDLALNSVGELNKKLRKERVKRKFLGGVSGAAILTIGYLLLKK